MIEVVADLDLILNNGVFGGCDIGANDGLSFEDGI